MHFQRKKFTCGPASAANALEALGHRRTEEELAALMGTTPEGTSPKQLMAGLTALKESCSLVGPGEIHERNARLASLTLLEALRAGRPVICCVKTDTPWDHWATAVGLLGPNIVLVDSGSEDLVLFYSPENFLARWRGPEGSAKPYYGVIV